MMIAEVKKEQLDELAALDERIFPESPWGRETFAENLNNSYDICLAAVDETSGRLMGFALLRTLDVAELLLIGTDECCRGQGIGSALMERLLKEAAEAGCPSLMLEVREHNLQAVRLYEKYGLREAHRRYGYYSNPKEDAIIMAKELRE